MFLRSYEIFGGINKISNDHLILGLEEPNLMIIVNSQFSP
jgi:hypothetical protein